MKTRNIIRKLAMRKTRLKKLESMLSNGTEEGACKIIEKLIRNEQILVKRAELELGIYLKQKELGFYQDDLKTLDEKREDSYCPACKYMYETPDGKKLTAEETREDSQCTLHPGREYTGYCPDFVDAEYVKWDTHFRQKYQEIKGVKQIVQETEREISELEKELKATKLEDL